MIDSGIVMPENCLIRRDVKKRKATTADGLGQKR